MKTEKFGIEVFYTFISNEALVYVFCKLIKGTVLDIILEPKSRFINQVDVLWIIALFFWFVG